MKPLFTVTVVAMLLHSTPGIIAADDHTHPLSLSLEQAEGAIIAKPNEVVLEVHGIVCSFCSVGVQKKLSKLPFVDRTKHKKGVHVAIEDQRVTIAIKPGEAVDMQMVYKSVRSGGYEPVQAVIADSEGMITRYGKEG